MNTETKRAYVKTELVVKPIQRYKALLERIALLRIEALEAYSNEVVTNLHRYSSLMQGAGIPPVTERGAAIACITKGIQMWVCEQTGVGDDAATQALVL